MYVRNWAPGPKKLLCFLIPKAITKALFARPHGEDLPTLHQIWHIVKACFSGGYVHICIPSLSASIWNSPYKGNLKTFPQLSVSSTFALVLLSSTLPTTQGYKIVEALFRTLYTVMTPTAPLCVNPLECSSMMENEQEAACTFSAFKFLPIVWK